MAKKIVKSPPCEWYMPLSIFLYGGSDEGKTKTLVKLYEKLTKTSFTKRNAVFPPFSYTKNAVTVTIYICTVGDDAKNTLNNIKNLDKNNQKQRIDIFITAVNNEFDNMMPNSLSVAQDYCTGLYSEITRCAKYALWVRKLNPKVVEPNYKDEKDPALQTTSIDDAKRLQDIIDNFIPML